MKERTIAVLTGTRADYGLLKSLMSEIQKDKELKLQVIATGTHLSAHYGMTVQIIEADGFQVDCRVPITLSSDTAEGMGKSLGEAVLGLTQALSQLKPDLLVVLGDRYETFAGAQAAMVLSIPVAHIHGGEVTEGAMDESMRHAISKMACLHFTSAEVYRKRVVQLGEDPARVFTVGAPGLDQIQKIKFLDKKALSEALNFSLGKRNILFCYHPETLLPKLQEQNISEIFSALKTLLEKDPDLTILATMPNADPQGRLLGEKLKQFAAQFPTQMSVHDNLGQQRFLSALEVSDVIMGNSSSGLIEAPAVHTPTLNIGMRQKGRLAGKSVLHVPASKALVIKAYKKVLTAAFKSKVRKADSPYGHGGSGAKIKKVLKAFKLNNILLKKFYDINFKLK